MKSKLLLALAILSVSCTKTAVTPTYNIEGTSWTMAGDTSLHLSFTTDSLRLTWPALEPNPSTASYIKRSRETIYIPAWEQSCVVAVTKDSLTWTNTKTGAAMQFYRN